MKRFVILIGAALLIVTQPAAYIDVVEAWQAGRENELNDENEVAASELAVIGARVDLLLDRMRLAALAGKLDEHVFRTINRTLDERP